MNTKLRILLASFVVTLAAAMTAGAAAGDEWFELSSQALDPANPSVQIKSEGGRWEKDVKQVKVSVEGADVEITSLVLHWDNRPDDTLTNVGVIKSGGETAPSNAPGLKARLKSVTVHYTIQGGATGATLKVWGYD
jgi:hypothetical protein